MIQRSVSRMANVLVVLSVLSISVVTGADEKAPPASAKTRSLRVAAASVVQKPRDIEGNLKRIERWARKAARARAELVLFPETAISGWWQSREIRAYGEPVDGPSIQRLIKNASRLSNADGRSRIRSGNGA